MSFKFTYIFIYANGVNDTYPIYNFTFRVYYRDLLFINLYIYYKVMYSFTNKNKINSRQQ